MRRAVRHICCYVYVCTTIPRLRDLVGMFLFSLAIVILGSNFSLVSHAQNLQSSDLQSPELQSPEYRSDSAVRFGFEPDGLRERQRTNRTTDISFRSNATPDFNDGPIRAAVGNLYALIEGSFGALIMVVAGFGAIIAAAMGSYRSAVSMVVVAVGAFTLRSFVSLFFGADFGGVGVGSSNFFTPQ